jgi:hypothetical protein
VLELNAKQWQILAAIPTNLKSTCAPSDWTFPIGTYLCHSIKNCDYLQQLKLRIGSLLWLRPLRTWGHLIERRYSRLYTLTYSSRSSLGVEKSCAVRLCCAIQFVRSLWSCALLCFSILRMLWGSSWLSWVGVNAKHQCLDKEGYAGNWRGESTNNFSSPPQKFKMEPTTRIMMLEASWLRESLSALNAERLYKF